MMYLIHASSRRWESWACWTWWLSWVLLNLIPCGCMPSCCSPEWRKEKWVKRNIYQKWRSREEEEEEVNGICINNPTPHSLATHPTFSPYSPQSNRNKNSWHGTIAIALWSTITPVIMICICSIKTRYVKTQFSGRKLYTRMMFECRQVYDNAPKLQANCHTNYLHLLLYLYHLSYSHHLVVHFRRCDTFPSL